jgi:hypothetical protein
LEEAASERAADNLFSASNLCTFFRMHDGTMERQENFWHRRIGRCVLTLLVVDDFGADAKKTFFTVDSFSLLQE